jgi:hypothetical protein
VGKDYQENSGKKRSAYRVTYCGQWRFPGQLTPAGVLTENRRQSVELQLACDLVHYHPILS